MAGSFLGSHPFSELRFPRYNGPMQYTRTLASLEEIPIFFALRGRFTFTIRAGVGFQFFAKGNLFYTIIITCGEGFFCPLIGWGDNRIFFWSLLYIYNRRTPYWIIFRHTRLLKLTFLHSDFKTQDCDNAQP